MRNLNLTLLLIIATLVNLNAQVTLSEDSVFQDPSERKAFIFEHLNLPPVLWENGIPLLDLSLFDGSDNPEIICDSRVFGLAYASIYSIPKPSNDQLADPDVAYTSAISSTNSDDDIPIMALHYNYDRLKPRAIEDGILYMDNDQLKETPGNTVSPFETRNDFISAPMLLKIYNQSPSFVVRKTKN